MWTAPLLAAAVAVASPGHVRELIAADRWSEALEEARSLDTAHDPDSVAALGEALYRAGRIDEAGDVLQPLAGTESPPARALAQLGLVRSAQGQSEEAVSLLTRAATAAPHDPWVLYRASGAAVSRAQAIEWLTRYLENGTGDDPDRLESARGTIRLYKALGERKVWVPAHAPDRVELPLKPLAGTGGGYFVEATIANGKKVRLLLDTGSGGLFVVERSVKKGGLAPLSEDVVFAGGDTGHTASTHGLLSRLALGDLEFADALITTTRDEFDPQGRIHGVLGLSVFSNYRVTIDGPRGRLVLSKGGDELPGAPFWNVEGQLLVRASAAAGHDGLFLLDTGAVRSMLSRTFAATIPEAQIDRAASVRTYGGHVTGATAVRGIKLRFQEVEGDGLPVNASDLTMRSRLGGVELSGFLGMDVLERARIVVDWPSRRVAVSADAKSR